jgi:hypothetical protein
MLAALLLISCGTSQKYLALSGDYLGQSPPGTEPELFAPRIVSTGMATRDIAMTPDGREIYFCVSMPGFSYATIMVTQQVNDRWTRPEVAPFAGYPNWLDFEPCIAPDGQKFYFLSTRPDYAAGDSLIGDQDIWMMDRTDTGWSEPYNPGAPVNTEDEEYFPSVTNDGTLYFTRQQKGSRIGHIYRSRFVDGHYTEPEKLPEQVNSSRSQYNAFIAPDESYLIVPVFGREDSFGFSDYYIVFRNQNDEWSEPINLGAKINSPGDREFSPYVSRDGKYFFFMATRGLPTEQEPQRLTWSFLSNLYDQPLNGNSSIYWMDAGFINNLKLKAENQKTE